MIVRNVAFPKRLLLGLNKQCNQYGLNVQKEGVIGAKNWARLDNSGKDVDNE